MLDTLKLARELREGGVFSPEQAERLAGAIAQFGTVAQAGATAQAGDQRRRRDVEVRSRDLLVRLGVLTWTVSILAALMLFALVQLFVVRGEVSANAAGTAVRIEAVVQRLGAIEQRLDGIERRLGAVVQPARETP